MQRQHHSSIAVLTCYFGKLPWYFDYFAYSCKFNPSIDFFIVTDDHEYSKPIPTNVKIIHKILADINVLASEKFGFPINIEYAYKLCDFKPTYGLLFSELLEGYDFWAHADIDMIFGDIRNFITEDILQNHDIISVRPDWLTGCFLLFRNEPKMNNLFTLSRDYKKVLTEKVYFNFDEAGFAQDEFTEGKSFHEVHTMIESMTHLVKRLEQDNYVRPFFDLFIIEGVPGKLKWEQGKLYFRNRYEVLLYHLIIFKTIFVPKASIKLIPQAFTISTHRIYHKK